MRRLDWARDGADWPLREASRFVQVGRQHWHVQRMGRGPPMLLLHGTGASTHSWRRLAPLLAPEAELLMPDLPGHGFSSAAPPGAASLPGIASALAGLLAQLGVAPTLIVGHSAGAAIALRMVLDGTVAPCAVVSLNGALRPWGGPATRLFSPLAKLLAATRMAPELFARRAEDRAMVERLIRGTGSVLDEEGVALYGRLLTTPGHAAGALAMMAAWDLNPLWADLPRLRVPLRLVVGTADRAVAPVQAVRVLERVPGASLHRLHGLGHLAHEEAPGRIAELIRFAVGEPADRSAACTARSAH